MGGCKINNVENKGFYFLAGGLKMAKKYISKKAYIYLAEENEVKELPPMLNIRYHFPSVYYETDKCIYVIGGR